MKKKELKDLHQAENKEKWHSRFMSLAEQIAEWSYCKKLKVGSVLVSSENRIIATGFNGTLSGLENNCEEENGLTKLSSYHAEENLLLECLRQSKTTVGATIYVTHFPCPNCAKLIAGAGIKKLYYRNDYKDLNGLELFKLAKVKVVKL